MTGSLACRVSNTLGCLCQTMTMAFIFLTSLERYRLIVVEKPLKRSSVRKFVKRFLVLLVPLAAFFACTTPTSTVGLFCSPALSSNLLDSPVDLAWAILYIISLSLVLPQLVYKYARVVLKANTLFMDDPYKRKQTNRISIVFATVAVGSNITDTRPCVCVTNTHTHMYTYTHTHLTVAFPSG